MSTAPVILYRKLDAQGDPVWGNGQGNLLSNVDAVAQLISTRLKLFEGEWWANKADGIPLWQSILGQTANTQLITILINQRILSTPYVSEIANLSVNYNSAARSFSYSATVYTQFGAIQVTNIPTVSNQGVPL